METLEKLGNVWESLAERDALWAILTDPGKAGGKWSVAEFMATGEAEIETVMNYLAAINCMPDTGGAALDFGCGVGRLTQAIAPRFSSCVGLDISQQMVLKAEALNRYKQCRYVANQSTRLPFEDEEFSFIYTNIVLQHMPRHLSKAYLHELLRVLKRSGVLVFGIQDSFIVRDAASLMIRIRQLLRFRSRIKDALGIGEGDMQMHCTPERMIRRTLGSAKIVDIQLTNTAAKDFNGKLVYLKEPPASGYLAKQYCVVK
jgi:ubiquinone/menaquinone biosynthesis C-methylase UbiE